MSRASSVSASIKRFLASFDVGVASDAQRRRALRLAALLDQVAPRLTSEVCFVFNGFNFKFLLGINSALCVFVIRFID